MQLVLGFIFLFLAANSASAAVPPLIYVPVVLMYHNIVPRYYLDDKRCDEATAHKDEVGEDNFCQPSSDTTLVAFLAQMEHLKAGGYRTLSMDEFYEYRTGKLHLNGPSIVLTFDDAYEGNYTLAMPILRSMNYKATFFVHTNYVETYKTDPSSHADPRAEGQAEHTEYNHMSWDDLRALEQIKGAGGKPLFVVYPHTMTHPFLSAIREQKELDDELQGSRQKVEKELGGKRLFTAYPYGDFTPSPPDKFSSRVIDAAQKAGYLMALGVDIPENVPLDVKNGNFAIPRVSMEVSSETQPNRIDDAFSQQIEKYLSPYRSCY